jgi:hypothetical protein
MPAEKFTKRANTPKKRRQWQHVYNRVKAKGGSSGDAVIEANKALKGAAIRHARRKARGSS